MMEQKKKKWTELALHDLNKILKNKKEKIKKPKNPIQLSTGGRVGMSVKIKPPPQPTFTRVVGPIIKPGAVNKNGRSYTSAVLNNAFQNYTSGYVNTTTAAPQSNWSSINIVLAKDIPQFISLDEMAEKIKDMGKKGKSSLIFNIKSENKAEREIAKALINFLGEIKNHKNDSDEKE